jgi:Zn-dependent peptidase ImmA (M78 family)
MGFNQRVFSLADFEHLINLETQKPSNRLLFMTGEFDANGMYFMRRGYPVIVMNRVLTGTLYLETGFHELAHHWLDEPGYCHHGGPRVINKAEYRAQRIAACMLIPKTLILTRTFNEIQDEYQYYSELLWFRKRTFEFYSD